MNIQPSNYKNKKYTVKSVRTEDYSETNKRPKEEFAREFLRAYDGAFKKIMRGERGKDAMEFIKELKKEIMEDE